MRKIVITGANGYVASHFTKELLNLDYKVVALVRDNKDHPADIRMKMVLDKIGGGVNNDSNLEVYSYNLLERDFALNKDLLYDIFKEDVDFFHFAACLKYNEKDKDDIFTTNVGGVENSLNIFTAHSTPGSRFFFISTVYSCGRISGLFEEKFYGNEEISRFRNYYEQSKRYAENIVRKNILENKINAHILRLSQVIGNNKTGEIQTDYGIFDFIKRIHKISQKYPDQTLRIRIDPESTQNLIPIDNATDYLIKVVYLHDLPRVVNLVGKRSVRNDQIVESICRLLPINIVQDKNLERKDMNSLERMIAAGMSFTGLYANTRLMFDNKNMDRYFSPNGNEVTEASLAKMIRYFIHTNDKENNNSSGQGQVQTARLPREDG